MQSASDRNFYQRYNVPADLVAEFKAPQDSIKSRVTQYLPPVTALPVISAFSPSAVLKFMIPESMGAIDTKTFRLHLKVKIAIGADN